MIERLSEVAGRTVPRETLHAIEAYAAFLQEEAGRQNLVSASTLDHLWERHVIDSAQLVRFAPQGASWVDIGAGAGLPGIVIALLVDGPVTLIEPRKLRADFLARTCEQLGIENRVTVVAAKAERATGEFGVLTARAVAPLDKLLRLSTHLSTENSLWVLPKGRNARSELDAARLHWQCDAEIHPSLTDPESGIVVLRRVKARGKR